MRMTCGLPIAVIVVLLLSTALMAQTQANGQAMAPKRVERLPGFGQAVD